MTAQRRDLNGWSRGIALIGLLAVILVPVCLHAATSERVVTDRYTGLAIGGFDPVAYFTDARPLQGLADFELSDEGTVWRFLNEGNRASFAAHPEIYGPQFGGYDPVDVARGVAFAGNPRFWLIAGQRLYLFGREESRDEFAKAPDKFVTEARKRWPGVQQALAR
jgi:YHS domain-containing protein